MVGKRFSDFAVLATGVLTNALVILWAFGVRDWLSWALSDGVQTLAILFEVELGVVALSLAVVARHLAFRRSSRMSTLERYAVFSPWISTQMAIVLIGLGQPFLLLGLLPIWACAAPFLLQPDKRFGDQVAALTRWMFRA